MDKVFVGQVHTLYPQNFTRPGGATHCLGHTGVGWAALTLATSALLPRQQHPGTCTHLGNQCTVTMATTPSDYKECTQRKVQLPTCTYLQTHTCIPRYPNANYTKCQKNSISGTNSNSIPQLGKLPVHYIVMQDGTLWKQHCTPKYVCTYV